VRAIQGRHNFDQHQGDGLSTGLSKMAPSLYAQAGVRPQEIKSDLRL